MNEKKWDQIDVELAAEAMCLVVEEHCRAAVTAATGIALETTAAEATAHLVRADEWTERGRAVCLCLSNLAEHYGAVEALVMAEEAVKRLSKATRSVALMHRVHAGTLPYQWAEDGRGSD